MPPASGDSLPLHHRTFVVLKHRHVSQLKMCTHLTIKVALALRVIHPSFVLRQKSPIRGCHCPFLCCIVPNAAQATP